MTDEDVCEHGYVSVHAYDFCEGCVAGFRRKYPRPPNWPLPVITNEEAVAAQRYDQELIELAADQIYRAAGDLYRECARADRLESENDRLSSYERRTRNPHNDWVPE